MLINVDINIEDKSWKQEDSSIQKNIKTLVRNIIQTQQISELLPDEAELEISILLTNDQKIRELNKNYRQKDKSTNVLSFPAIDPNAIKNNNLPMIGDFLPLGDIVLSYDTIKKESVDQNKLFSSHLAHMTTHSILHLLGYDHIEDTEANMMEELETKILKTLDIEDPYNL